MSLAFAHDGLSFTSPSWTGDTLYKYDLSTAWDLSTASYSGESLSVAAYVDRCYGVEFGEYGSRMYVLDFDASSITDSIVQFSTGAAGSVSVPASVVNPPSQAASVGDSVSYEFVTLDGGTTVHLISEQVL